MYKPKMENRLNIINVKGKVEVGRRDILGEGRQRSEGEVQGKEEGKRGERQGIG